MCYSARCIIYSDSVPHNERVSSVFEFLSTNKGHYTLYTVFYVFCLLGTLEETFVSLRNAIVGVIYIYCHI